MSKIKRQFNTLEARAVSSIIQYALENEMERIDDDEIEDAYGSCTKQVAEWWYMLEPEASKQLQSQINAALKAFFGKEID